MFNCLFSGALVFIRGLGHSSGKFPDSDTDRADQDCEQSGQVVYADFHEEGEADEAEGRVKSRRRYDDCSWG